MMTILRSKRRSVRSFGLIATMVLLLAGCDWSMFGFGPTHTSYNPFERTIGVGNVAGLHEVWSATTGDGIVSPPSIVGSVAYVGSRDNKLYAFSAVGTTGCSGTPKTCRPLWSTPPLGGDVVTSPAVANGMVYVGSVGEKVFAFDAAGVQNCSGTPKVCQPLWSRTMTGDVISSPTAAGSAVYAIAANVFSDELDALDGATGALRWRAIVGTDLGGAAHSTSAVSVAKGVVYAGFNAGSPAMVAAFDANGVMGCSGVPDTCEPLWTAPVGTASRERTPVLDSGFVFASTDFTGLNAYDAAGTTGCSSTPKICTPLWTASAPLATPAVANGVVFVGASAFDALGNTACSGAPKTCDPLWSNADGVVGGIANGVAYSTSSTTVTAYDAAGTTACAGSPKVCAALWSTSVTDPTSPVITNGKLWIGSTDHKLHVFALG